MFEKCIYIMGDIMNCGIEVLKRLKVDFFEKGRLIATESFNEIDKEQLERLQKQLLDLTFILHLLSPPLEIVNNRFPDMSHRKPVILHAFLFQQFHHHQAPESDLHA